MNSTFRRTPDSWSQRDEAREMEHRRERLDEELALADQALERAESQVRVKREKVSQIQERLAQRVALLDELSDLADRENEAQVLMRRAERKLERRLGRRLDIDVQAERVRPGRMVKVVVDPAAWEAFREHSRLRTFQGIGVSVGQLVAAEFGLIEAGDTNDVPSDRRRRSPGEAEPLSSTKSLRILVDEDIWPIIALHVSRSPLTIGRYVGELVEAAAHELGWRAT